MQHASRTLALGVALALLSGRGCNAEGARLVEGSSTRSLGGAPLCEASAAAVVPCAATSGSCLLVGDNELRRRVALFPITDDGLDVAARRLLSIEPLLSSADDAELSDIEAIARRSNGDLLLVGSHSRNKDCKRRANRRRYVGARLRDGASVGVASPRLVSTPKRVNLHEAFAPSSDPFFVRVQEEVERAERAADAGRCEQAFEIEAAVAIPGERGEGGERRERKEQIWLGLRRPLVEGRAIWLRQVDLDAGLRFDAARSVQLDGAGIRGAVYSEGFVYGLSPRPGGGDFRLWRFPASALAARRPIEVEDVAAVPARSEGVAVAGNRAFVVQDGRMTGEACEVEAGYTVVPLSP